MVLLNSDYERMTSGSYLLFTCQSFALLCRTLITCAWCLICCLIEVIWLRVGARRVSGLSLNFSVDIVVVQDCKPGVGGGSYWNYEWTSKHGRGRKLPPRVTLFLPSHLELFLCCVRHVFLSLLLPSCRAGVERRRSTADAAVRWLVAIYKKTTPFTSFTKFN